MNQTIELDPAIAHRDPEIMSGVLCFTGTRVPVRNLFDFLEGGDSIDKFLHSFPTVKREQVIQFLESCAETVNADVFDEELVAR